MMTIQQQYEDTLRENAKLREERDAALPVIRSAIMLLVEIQLLYVPKEGHFNAQINARIESLKKRLPAKQPGTKT